MSCHRMSDRGYRRVSVLLKQVYLCLLVDIRHEKTPGRQAPSMFALGADISPTFEPCIRPSSILHRPLVHWVLEANSRPDILRLHWYSEFAHCKPTLSELI